nr:hypothetical protein [uncultured Pseudoxanthomonas sp.]
MLTPAMPLQDQNSYGEFKSDKYRLKALQSQHRCRMITGIAVAAILRGWFDVMLDLLPI